MHKEASEYAGKTVTLKPDRGHLQGHLKGKFHIEDWWDTISGKSWGDCGGNPGCLIYALRAGSIGLPSDDEVLYGKGDNGLSDLIHISEIEN